MKKTFSKSERKDTGKVSYRCKERERGVRLKERWVLCVCVGGGGGERRGTG